ncbi:MAG: tRNA lysidine(34) synthetase TilS [Bacteroidales bacterium]
MMSISNFDKHLMELGVKANDRVIVAVSGGMDSMCLLHGLFNSSLKLKCSVAHVNFHLRGEESNIDENAVKEWCETNDIELFVRNVDTIAYSKEHSVSIEMAARDLRYMWFYELMKEHDFNFLAIAHNANDNAETLMLNLVRGTGVRGLCGIAQKNGTIIRPLLCYTRKQIEKYIFNFKIPYRVDRTNLESDIARNRIRNEVFPQFGKINPSVILTLNRDIKYFSMASKILESLATEKKQQLLDCKLRICIDKLIKEEFWPYWLYMILQDYGFNSARVDDIVETLCDKEVKRYLSGSHIVVKERGMLKIYQACMLDTIPHSIVPGTGTFKFGTTEISLELKNNSKEIMDALHNTSGCLFVSADNIVFPLHCRTMLAGDKFCPFGMTGMKKISDFLTNIKVDNILRNRVPILLNGSAMINENPGNNVICLPGFRIDSRFKVTLQTKTVLIVKINN